ncbi:putative FAD-linked oxidoreductase YvdP [Madurella mycetomatis]|uniref:FAD-linked oxidoreductase YvdP n=1 Tax=Madurella mycetomatis TaxID=100816 RepID=A0A175WA71_9PEZI|nr:putative FAD-linked oxidoreductase YvdP [Madurella mycetomatis]
MSEVTIQALHELNNELQNGEVVFRGTTEYEAAVWIGNLLYRMISPLAIVVVKSVEEIQKTISFAKAHELQLTVKNGGHSYAAYCLNKDGIVLDISLLRKVTIDTENMTVTMQGGAIWKDCPTVGVSGFTLGGGLSPFSRSYGLGVDSVLEMTIVTASGDIVTVKHNDTDQDKKDLFWALRGGGGGNFGVTVSIVSKLHKLRDRQGAVVCGSLSWQISRPEKRRDFLRMMEAFNKTEWPPELSVDALWRSDNGGDLVGDMTILYNGPMAGCLPLIAPLLACAPDINLREMKWMDWIQMEMQTGFGIRSKIYHHHSSFIFPHGAINDGFVNTVLTLLEEAKKILSDRTLFPGLADGDGSSRHGVHFLWDHMGGETATKSPTDTAFFWRKGEYAANIKFSWSHPSQTEVMMRFEQKCKHMLSPYTVQGKAAYLNYIDDTQANWQESYYGDNYKRLVDIKKKWDPGCFWRFHQSIGSEGQYVVADLETETRELAVSGVPADGGIPKRWREFSVKNPLTIQSAGGDVNNILLANLVTRREEGNI